MDLKLETLAIFLVLLPGFVSSTILDMVITRRPKDTFAKVVEALVLSFVIYALLIGIFGFPMLSVPAEVQKLPGVLGSEINARFVLGAFILAIVLPLIIGLIAASDRHMKVLRWVGITHKTSRDSIWLDVFIEQKRYVNVNFKDKRRIFGWPMYYSEDSQKLLYLQNPAWIDDDGNYLMLDVHGIFLVDPENIESIEFTNVDESSAQPERSGDGTQTRQSPTTAREEGGI